MPNPRRPSPQYKEPPPPGQPPATPAARNVRKGMQAKGSVPGPHTRTPAPTACGQRAPIACPKDGQPGEGERLTLDAAHHGTRHRPRGRPPATPTTHNANSQERALWDRCWAPIPAPPRARRTRAAGPGILPKGWAVGGG